VVGRLVMSDEKPNSSPSLSVWMRSTFLPTTISSARRPLTIR
jgi:hypothetical protein